LTRARCSPRLSGALSDELFTLSFVKTGDNAVLVGPNGVGKPMPADRVWILPSQDSHFSTTSPELRLPRRV
jgi:hypothetical protein